MFSNLFAHFSLFFVNCYSMALKKIREIKDLHLLAHLLSSVVTEVNLCYCYCYCPLSSNSAYMQQQCFLSCFQLWFECLKVIYEVWICWSSVNFTRVYTEGLARAGVLDARGSVTDVRHCCARLTPVLDYCHTVLVL